MKKETLEIERKKFNALVGATAKIVMYMSMLDDIEDDIMVEVVANAVNESLTELTHAASEAIGSVQELNDL